MKILKRIFVFALFAFAAVLAFGAINVKAAEIAVYTANFEEADGHRTSGNNSYTTNSYTSGGVVWNLQYGDSVTSGTPISGTANIMLRIAKNTTNVATATSEKIYADSISAIEYKVNLKHSGLSFVAEYSTDNTNWTELTNPTITDKTYKHNVSINGNIYLKFTVTVQSSTGSNRDAQFDDIVIYGEDAQATKLDVPTSIVLNENTISWNTVVGALGYEVSLGAIVVAANVQGNSLDLSSVDLSGVAYGSHTIKVIALGDDSTTLDSQAGICATEYLYKYTFKNNTTFIYKNYEELLPLAPNDNSESTKEYYAKVYINAVTNPTYGNCDVIDENGDSFVIWGLYDFTGATRYDALDAAIKPKAGDEIVVRGIIQNFGGTTFEIKNAKLLQLNGEKLADEIAVGVQTADAGEGKKHVRLVGGLNIDYEEITSLSFTITNAANPALTTTITITSVYGELTVSSTNAEITVKTAESEGFESLFALTITNILAGTTLNVTATCVTASGTYTSAVKTVEVPAAQ